MILRRIVFGEPRPGEAKFAGLLSKLDESVSYCNRTGPLQHDRVTDVPYTIPMLGLNFVHPTELQFISVAPPTDDDWGIFAEHHVELYAAGNYANDTYWRAAQLCAEIYKDEPLTSWTQRQDTAGVAWALRVYGKTAFVVFRGSKTPLDWLRDLTGFDPHAQDDPVFGVMWDGFMLGMPDAWAAIEPALAGMEEVIFTGHSLGAARADVAAGYALAAA